MTIARLLCADDRSDVLDALRLLLTAEGFQVEAASSPQAVLAALGANEFSVALIDLNYTRDSTSGREGLDLLSRIRSVDPDLPIVVMTAWATVEGAVEAMRRGARDYVQKPWDNARLITTLRTHANLSWEKRRNRRLTAENDRLRSQPIPWLGESAAMKPVLSLIDKVARSDANVLITGEHGTGKEVIARALHVRSQRSSGPFIAVNAAALPDSLFESELFGHVKGAFTDARADRIGSFELADEGTLFLDEIGDMPVEQQAKLLRALQTNEFRPVGASVVRRVSVRVVTATNADLDSGVRSGRFREDLLFRLNTIEIRLPLLRDRREDIRPLAELFLSRVAQRYGRGSLVFSEGAVRALEGYRWPGNVRELEHVVERAVLLSVGTAIQSSDLSLGGDQGKRSIDEMTLEEVEAHLIQKALSRSNGNVAQAAKALGLSRSALYRRLAAYSIRTNDR